MRIPIDWLKDFVQFDLGPEPLAERLTMGGLEVEEILRLPEGEVLSIYITPNRGDCLSVYGIAREVYALLGKDCEPTPLFEEARRGFGALDAPAEPGEAANYSRVEILDPDLCPRYAARIVTGLKIAPSPAPIQRRLLAAGMRPISNVVDATNYVMLELGQPLHAFDLQKLKENRIVVRQAKPGETILTLDDVEREVSPPMLMICDAERPVAVAGVMGGMESEVSWGTQTILLESAHFNPLSVRRTSRQLDLRTEASYRFERYVDPQLVVAALNRVCALIEQMTGVPPVPGVLDVYPKPAKPREGRVRLERSERLLGYSLHSEEVQDALQRLQLQPKVTAKRTFQVIVPTYRPDLQREDDLIEEIGRVLGYERIPEALPTGTTTQGRDSDLSQFAERVRRVLLGLGLQEVVNHTLEAPSPLHPPGVEPVPLRNPMSEELSLLRPCLLSGLMATADRNRRHGIQDVHIFEIGRVFRRAADQAGGSGQGAGGGDLESEISNPEALSPKPQPPTPKYEERLSLGILLMGMSTPPHWQGKPAEADFYTLKGMIDHLMAALGIPFWVVPADDGRLHPGRSAQIIIGASSDAGVPAGILGEIHPEVLSQLDFKRRVYVAELGLERLRELAVSTFTYRPLPRYPALLRDIAFLVEQKVPYAELEATLREAAGEWLESWRLFDRYTGTPVSEGWHSLAFSLAFRHPERSLTDEEVNRQIEAIFTALERRFGVKRRG